MPTLSEVVAVTKDRKSVGERTLTEAYKTVQRGHEFEGSTKTYSSLDEDGPSFPAENNPVVSTVEDVVERLQDSFVRMLDVTRIQDEGNTLARADVVVNGNVLLEQVPATHLLYLEKTAESLHTFVSNLPTLDPAIDWSEPDAGLRRSKTSVTSNKTSKVQEPVVLYDATEHHPAQTQLITRDVVVGNWTAVRFSGAISRQRKNLLVQRTRDFRDAVRVAREQANQTHVDDKVTEGNTVFDFIFGD